MKIMIEKNCSKFPILFFARGKKSMRPFGCWNECFDGAVMNVLMMLYI